MEINLTDRTKLTKSKTSDNFFPTQISVECQTTKLPFLFQNPIINSGFKYEQKKEDLINQFLTHSFGSNSKILKKIVNYKLQPLNFFSFSKNREKKVNDFSLKNTLYLDRTDRIKLKKNNTLFIKIKDSISERPKKKFIKKIKIKNFKKL
jgi:hypothetical protein